ncbi:DUF4249 family protein [Labilibacter marinus]|uniref:DUF4249 family protein n=1 Tax=Labilibacter marinus TaxID=1477105 RepID=UPI00083276DB|nr:DUF4249 family protein [Labilibacter marinus]
MKIRTKHYYIYTIVLILLTSLHFSCKKDEVNPTDEYMVHCILYEGKTPKIGIYRLLDVHTKYPFNIIYHEDVTSWEMEIRKNNETIYNNFTHMVYSSNVQSQYPDGNKNISYFSNDNILPISGDTYSLKVEIGENDVQTPKVLTASTSIPSKVPFTLEQLPTKNVNPYTKYKISFTDPGPEKDFYYLVAMAISPINNFVNKGSINIDRIWENLGSRNSSYQISHLTQVTSKWTGLDTNTTSDEKNTYPSNYYGTLFTDESFNEKRKEIFLEPIQYFGDDPYGAYLSVELYHITEDYYRHYESTLRQVNAENDIYSEPVQVYSNVKNGHGLFGGASISRQIIEIKQE